MDKATKIVKKMEKREKEEIPGKKKAMANRMKGHGKTWGPGSPHDKAINRAIDKNK